MGQLQAERDKEIIAELFFNGKASITELTRLYAVDYKYIVEILTEMGVSTPKKIELDEFQLRNMKSSGMTIKKIADYYGVSVKEFNKMLDEENLGFVFGRVPKVPPPVEDTVKSHIEQCKDCKYKGRLGVLGDFCNYISMVGTSRGCTVANCERKVAKE